MLHLETKWLWASIPDDRTRKEDDKPAIVVAVRQGREIYVNVERALCIMVGEREPRRCRPPRQGDQVINEFLGLRAGRDSGRLFVIIICVKAARWSLTRDIRPLLRNPGGTKIANHV